jgi:acyl-CoA thioesterase FadM
MRVDERMCAEGYGVYVGFDYDGQHSVPLPEQFRARLEAQAAGAQA